MPSHPSISNPAGEHPVLTRRGWERLPLVRTNYVALSAGLHPGEYRMPNDSYERYLARRNIDAVTEDRWSIVDCLDGLTLRLDVDRACDGEADRRLTPELLRAAIERLVETALGAGAGGCR